MRLGQAATIRYTTLPALGQGLIAGQHDKSRSSLPVPDPAEQDLLKQTFQTSPTPPTASGQPLADDNDAEQDPSISDGEGVQSLGDFLALDSSDVATPSQKTSVKPNSGEKEPAAQPAVIAAAATADGALPWERASSQIRSPLLRLHNEIAEFCRFLEPTDQERACRHAAMQRVSDIVTAIFPSATVQVFGSYATGLFLPTSDMDLVVTGSGCGNVPQGLRALAQAFSRKNMVKNVQVVAKARVPIIKFEERESGINFDISFDVANGPVAAGYVRELITQLPPMRPLLFILKIFLQQREMNEVYTGGIGSYALLVMVAAFLQTHPSRAALSSHSKASAPLEGSLGVLLLDFFRLYGRSLHAEYVGVSCKGKGGFYDKRSRGLFQYERPNLLSVEDPQDGDNDLGRNSWNASRVRQAFEYAYTQLARGGGPGDSLLQRVVRLDAVIVDRPRPPALPDYAAMPPPEQTSAAEAGEVPAGTAGLQDSPAGETKRERRRRQEAEKKAARKGLDGKKRVRERDMVYSASPELTEDASAAGRYVPQGPEQHTPQHYHSKGHHKHRKHHHKRHSDGVSGSSHEKRKKRYFE